MSIPITRPGGLEGQCLRAALSPERQDLLRRLLDDVEVE